MADTTSGKVFDVLDEFFQHEQIGHNNLGLYLRNIYKYDELIDLNSTRQIICGSTVDGTFSAKVKLLQSEKEFSELNIDIDIDVLINRYMNFLQESNCVEDIAEYPGFVYLIGTPGEDNYLYYLRYVPNKYNKLCLSSKATKYQFLQDEDDPIIASTLSTGLNLASVKMTFKNGLFDVNIDFVPAMAFYGWPNIASRKCIRKKHCPLNCDIDTIYHAVPKPYSDLDSDRDVQWRYSFSVEETLLIQAMSDNQWKCCYMCKRLFFNHIVSKTISTYHLKTIVLWKCESVPSHIWDHNLGRCVILIIDELIHAFASHRLPHYFIPEQNLLQYLPSESVTEVSKELLQLREKLMDDRNLGRCRISFIDEEINDLGNILLSPYFVHESVNNHLTNLAANILSWTNSTELFKERTRLINELCLRDPNKYPCSHGMFSLPFLFWALQYRTNINMGVHNDSIKIGWWPFAFQKIIFHLVKLISDVIDKSLHFELYLKRMYIGLMNENTADDILKEGTESSLKTFYMRLAMVWFNSGHTNFEESTCKDSLTKLDRYYDWNEFRFLHNFNELRNQFMKSIDDTPVINIDSIIPDLHFEWNLIELYITLANVILDTGLAYKECMIHELRQARKDINSVTEEEKEQMGKITDKYTFYFRALINIVKSQMDELKTENYSLSEYLHILQIVIGDKIGKPPNVTRLIENLKDHEELLKLLPNLLTGCYGIFLQKID